MVKQAPPNRATPAAGKRKRPAGPERPRPGTGIPASTPRPFPIVAIGASAGGLEALEQFFRHVPPDSGMAFVVIQHLDPNHKGMMPELLQRLTPMPVAQARNRARVLPEHVYV
ncbi:MAG: chemotaxis protein CheB, partial [Rhodocyclaceae bacterium]|nr:chemotaxis protein CheB [Rhodocyclaceae bacterium]